MGERGPRADDSPWQVSLGGAVRRPCAFSLDELRGSPQIDMTVDVHCVTRWSRPQVRFRGIPLAALVERAGPMPEARFVSFVARSDRRHSTSLVLADALALGALVTLEMEGEPLRAERGGPVRMVVPGRYFYKSLKWLERVELLVLDRLGYWESTAGYHNTADPWRQQRYMAEGISPAEARRILDTRDIRGKHLLSLRAGERSLPGLAAQDALLRDADFRGCNLDHANFDRANLTNAHFQGASLRGASLRGADLEGADFSGADLRGACLAGASLLGASFFDPAEASSIAQMDRGTAIDRRALNQLPPDQAALVEQALFQAEDARP
jgi:hypothetical protein